MTRIPALLVGVLFGLPLTLAGSGSALPGTAWFGLGAPARAQMNHDMHRMHGETPAAAVGADPAVDSGSGGHVHGHDLGPAGSTYDLRWIDAMVQHHTGALRMSEYVFDIGVPGVGALARQIWREQAQEIKAMGQWRRAWYPEAATYPMALVPGGDPNAMASLQRMAASEIAAMRMIDSTPTRQNRVQWFLEGMLHHHGGALLMAHDALARSTSPTIRRLARAIIVAQRREILELRNMLRLDGLDKPEYHRYDRLFSLQG